MSSPASRQRQRHRRRARERLWAIQKDLAERQVDLVSYERVIADLTKQQQRVEVSPAELSQDGVAALQLVSISRDVTRADCERLLRFIETQKQRIKDLEPKQDDPAAPQPSDLKETMHP